MTHNHILWTPHHPLKIYKGQKLPLLEVFLWRTFLSLNLTPTSGCTWQLSFLLPQASYPNEGPSSLRSFVAQDAALWYESSSSLSQCLLPQGYIIIPHNHEALPSNFVLASFSTNRQLLFAVTDVKNSPLWYCHDLKIPWSCHFVNGIEWFISSSEAVKQ